MEITHGQLLGGRLQYAQPREGYRTGIEPVLLAASVAAQPGQRVLEAGTGAGAGLLCLAARVPDLQCVGVEIDPAMADLARRNVADNRLDTVEIVTGDIRTVALGRFDHAFANPPWHHPNATRSPVDRRRVAKQETGADLERWIEAIARMLSPGGSLTLMVPPALVDRARSAARDSGFGAVGLRKLPAKLGRLPKLALVDLWLVPERIDLEAAPTILHAADGSFTPEIESILRPGQTVLSGERPQAARPKPS